MLFVVGYKSERRERPLRRAELARAALAILEGSPGERHSLGAVAAKLNVSPFHLAHVFRAEVGTSIHQYLLQLRLSVALTRLAEGTGSLSALALDLGFSTHSHFTAAFRRRYGITPREARLLFTKRGDRNGATVGLPPAA